MNLISKKQFSLLAVVFFLFLFHHTYVNSFEACNGGTGDCVKYSQMTEGFRSGQFNAVEAPFNQRILGPLIAAFIPFSISTSFLILNSLCFFLFFIVWIRISHFLSFSSQDIIFSSFWLLLHPIGFSIYYHSPIHIDPLWYLISALCFLFWLQRQYFYLCFFLLLGVATKESFLFLILTMFLTDIARPTFSYFTKSFGKNKPSYSFGNLCSELYVPFLTYSSSFLFLLAFKTYSPTVFFPQTQQWEVSASSTIIWFLKIVRNDLQLILVWIATIAVSTGFISLFIFQYLNSQRKKITLFMQATENRIVFFLTLATSGFVVLGLVAGSDMSRIIFNGFVFIFSFFFYLTHLYQESEIIKSIVKLFSLLIAFFYTCFFPAAFEYDYYITKEIQKTEVFLFVVLMTYLVLFCILKLLRPYVKIEKK